MALIETISCRVERLADVDDTHAIDEGEGYADAAAFRVDHEKFWNGYIDDLRTQLGDPSFTLTDDTPVVLERFRVVERIDAVRWWDIYGRHGQALYGTPSFTFWQAPRTFALLTGEPNLDLNVCNLAPGATAEDAAALLAVIDGAGAPPTVVPVSTRALPEAADTLREAGFVAIGPEVAMWRPPMPVAPVPGPFAVRKARESCGPGRGQPGHRRGARDRVRPRGARVRPRWARGGQDQLLGRMGRWRGGCGRLDHERRGAPRRLGDDDLARASTARRCPCRAHDRARGACGRGRAGHVPVGVADGPAAVRVARVRAVRRRGRPGSAAAPRRSSR